MAVPNSQLAAETNLFNAGQVEDFYTRNLPGYGAMRGQQSGVIGQQLAGQVPGDVVNQIIQQAAERGISTGLSGSPNESSALLRALGLTSIGQQQTGMANLDRSIQQTPVPELFAPQSLFVPQMLASQELAYSLAGQRNQQNRATSAQRIPDPVFGGGGGQGGGMPNLRSPVAQYNNIPAFMGGGSSQFNSPVIGGSQNIGGSSFFGGQAAPTQGAYNNWNQWNQSMPWNNQPVGGATANPSMTDQQWEDTFWY